ncbi:hypothetical protein J6590_046332 [Homalodisca vitripennis]|nr:hypothetical protein J6590_046332 [Homalodisca vitripennis]
MYFELIPEISVCKTAKTGSAGKSVDRPKKEWGEGTQARTPQGQVVLPTFTSQNTLAVSKTDKEDEDSKDFKPTKCRPLGSKFTRDGPAGVLVVQTPRLGDETLKPGWMVSSHEFYNESTYHSICFTAQILIRNT